MIDRSAYPTHADLLSQVASSNEKRDAVRRILGEPLAEHELDTARLYKAAERYPIRFTACTNGPCKQGRKLCPTPQACQIGESEPDRPPMRRGDALRLILLGLASWAAIAVALYAMGGAAVMKTVHVLPLSHFPSRMPLLHTLVSWLFLDRLQVSGWVWGVAGTLVCILWLLWGITRWHEKSKPLAGYGEEQP